MKNIFLILTSIYLTACAFPLTPGEGNLLNGTRQFRGELFNSGARGVAVVSMSDNVSKTGFFGRSYEQVMSFKNLNSGEPFYFKTEMGGDEYDWAMLPVGKYEITNLYLQYSYTTCQTIGNSQHCTTHVETIEDFQGNDKIRFTVRPGAVVYVGNIDLIVPDNTVNTDGKISTGREYKITDQSAKIPQDIKDDWRKEFGRDYIVGLASAK